MPQPRLLIAAIAAIAFLAALQFLGGSSACITAWRSPDSSTKDGQLILLELRKAASERTQIMELLRGLMKQVPPPSTAPAAVVRLTPLRRSGPGPPPDEAAVAAATVTAAAILS